VRIVFISDTHSLHSSVRIPDGDVLVHAGDCCNSGSMADLISFADWFTYLPHPHKILIAGNHDWCFERTRAKSESILAGITYLRDSSATVGGVKFYGSPWQPEFCCWAFNLPRGKALREKWDLIPADTDVLVTHGPPIGIGDVTLEGDSTGCSDLWEAVGRVKPKIHAFGHIHEGYGVYKQKKTLYINASICNRGYEPCNPPIVIDLEKSAKVVSG
jgi:predicted phosphodiesterase